jgi:hypothetical protein
VDAGGESMPSVQASATTQPGGGAISCHVTYVDQNDWGSGFTANLSITNSSGSAINSWTLAWTWSGNQQLSGSAWNANSKQVGETVTLTNESYNGSLAAGATISGIGFNASYSGTNSAPTAFALNAVRCQ